MWPYNFICLISSGLICILIGLYPQYIWGFIGIGLMSIVIFLPLGLTKLITHGWKDCIGE